MYYSLFQWPVDMRTKQLVRRLSLAKASEDTLERQNWTETDYSLEADTKEKADMLE